MATKREQWQNIKQLGSGGQGTVFLVRRPEAAAEYREAAKRIESALMSTGGGIAPERVKALAEDLHSYGRPSELGEVAALKDFFIGGRDEKQAIGRLEAEIKALKTIQHPAILKLIDASVEERFLVTEYFPSGSLSKKLSMFKGDPLRAVTTFKALVEGVKQIHDRNAIHRDIKPENIFVSESGSLVLGDFGIVIFKSDDRLTATYERAGTRYWMAPWVDRKSRILLDNVDATLDIYPLGKLLWCMISGEDMLPREEFEEDEYDLAALFPDAAREMNMVNHLLKRCVVGRRKHCLPNVDDLLLEVENLERRLSGGREGNIQSWPCRLCRTGMYEPQRTAAEPNRASVPLVVQMYQRGFGVDNEHHIRVYACNHCGHVELFMTR